MKILDQTITDNASLYHGDCVEVVKGLPDQSIHFSVFSPPFSSLYTYSNSDRDIGNCSNHSDFEEHFRYLIKELSRVTIPGRLCSIHCMNLPSLKSRDGFIGIKDFRGEIISMFEAEGWIFHSEVCIWKDPVMAMQRTKAIGLLHRQLCKDSSLSRHGIADYLVTMRRPGENPERITNGSDVKFTKFIGESPPTSGKPGDKQWSIDVWQRYASPVWMDINPSDTLQYRSAREHNDERHIAPLQLDVIRRAVELWSNPRDIVLSPFMGIGSEGFVAAEMGRRFVGVELKESYYRQAVKNIASANRQQDLFAKVANG